MAADGQRSRWIAATHTARRKQEPIHEYALAIVVWIVGEQTMPLVFLLTAAIASASIGLHLSEMRSRSNEGA